MFEEKVPFCQGKLPSLPLGDFSLRGPLFSSAFIFPGGLFSAISIDSAQQLSSSKGTFSKSTAEGSSSWWQNDSFLLKRLWSFTCHFGKYHGIYRGKCREDHWSVVLPSTERQTIGMSFNMPGLRFHYLNNKTVRLYDSNNSYCFKITWLLFLRVLNIVTLGYIICPCLSRQCKPRICLVLMKFLSPYFRGLCLWCLPNLGLIDWS